MTLNWEIRELPGRASPLSAVLSLRRGEWITAAADGSVQLWRAGRPIGSAIARGQGEERCLLELADGVVVSGGNDGSLRLWRDGVPLAPPIGAGGAAITSLTQLDDGELISGDEAGHLRRWRAGLPLGEPIHTGHDGVVRLLARGDTVFSLGSEGQLATWLPGQPATTLLGRQSVPVRHLVLLQNGELVTSHDDGSLRRWRGGQPVELGYAATADLGALMVLPGGRLLAADGAGALHLLDPAPVPDWMPVDSGQQGVWSLVVNPMGT